MFWYDSCHHRKEKNLFHDLETCKSHCETSSSSGFEYREENSNDVAVVILKDVKATLSEAMPERRSESESPSGENEVWKQSYQKLNHYYEPPSSINVSLRATIQASGEQKEVPSARNCYAFYFLGLRSNGFLISFCCFFVEPVLLGRIPQLLERERMNGL